MKNKVFAELFGTKEVEWAGDSWDTTLYAHHKLLREIPYEGVTGGKNGFVPQAGTTLVTTAKRKNLNLIIITLKSASESEAYNDTIDLLDFGFENFTTSRLSTEGSYSAVDLEYIVPQEVIYTHFSDEKLRIEIKENGMLEVINFEDRIVSSQQLQRLDDNERRDSSINEEKPEPVSDPLFSNFHYLSIAVILIAALLYYRIRKIS